MLHVHCLQLISREVEKVLYSVFEENSSGSHRTQFSASLPFLKGQQEELCERRVEGWGVLGRGRAARGLPPHPRPGWAEAAPDLLPLFNSLPQTELTTPRPSLGFPPSAGSVGPPDSRGAR